MACRQLWKCETRTQKILVLLLIHVSCWFCYFFLRGPFWHQNFSQLLVYIFHLLLCLYVGTLKCKITTVTALQIHAASMSKSWTASTKQAFSVPFSAKNGAFFFWKFLEQVLGRVIMAIWRWNMSQCYSDSIGHYGTSQIKDLNPVTNYRDNCIPEQLHMTPLARFPRVSARDRCINSLFFWKYPKLN